MKTGLSWFSVRTRDSFRHALWSAIAGIAWTLLGWAYLRARVGFTPVATSSLPPLAETAVRIFLLPWDLPGQYGFVSSMAEWNGWKAPILSFLVAAALIWFVSLLWLSLQSRRWMIVVLVVVLLVPRSHALYLQTAFLQRLLPPTAPACSPRFSGKGVVRYDDLSPQARAIITEDEFQRWDSWADLAVSFQRVPKVSTQLYVLALDRKRCGPAYSGTTVVISYNPRTTQLYRVETEEGRPGWP
jgi:hypothetical protein